MRSRGAPHTTVRSGVDDGPSQDVGTQLAQVVPTVEWDASMGRAKPGECIVRYFDDNSLYGIELPCPAR